MSSSLALDASYIPRLPVSRPRLAYGFAFVAWLVASLAMLAIFAPDIVRLDFMDTDDALRLTQVRDWLAGQSWFDVTQRRINPPIGGPMHWSRLVDLPIAAVILLARPLIGQASAEMLACAIVPLLTLGVLAAALFQVARRLGGEITAAVAVALLCTTPTILIQMTPIRIDHHAWQAVMGMLALGGALDARRGRGGTVAGVAIACWLQISTEGLPYAALFGGLFVLRYWMDPREGQRLSGFTLIGIAAPLLLIAAKGPDALIDRACDALSAVYVWPLAIFGGIAAAGMRMTDQDQLRHRVAIPLIGGLAAGCFLLWMGAECLTKGPFHQLTPLSYQHWYMRVMEGRPLWEQQIPLAGVSLLPSLLGLFGTAMAMRATTDRAIRTRWVVLGALLLGATLVSALVMRAMTVAHSFALPGAGWLLIAGFRKAQANGRALIRVPLSAALVAASPVGVSAVWASLTTPLLPKSVKKTNCRTSAVLAPLNALPPSLLFTPLDIGPDILAHSAHSVVGTGHHRNVIGINAVTHAFLSGPDAARNDVMSAGGGKGADYLVVCPRMNEMLLYAQSAPNGLAAQLARGQVPAWLQPLPGKGALHIYRVRRD